MWRDAKPSVDDIRWRRVIRVGKVDDTLVHGVGWWQKWTDGEWRDNSGIGARMGVHMPYDRFTQQYTAMESA